MLTGARAHIHSHPHARTPARTHARTHDAHQGPGRLLPCRREAGAVWCRSTKLRENTFITRVGFDTHEHTSRPSLPLFFPSSLPLFPSHPPSLPPFLSPLLPPLNPLPPFLPLLFYPSIRLPVRLSLSLSPFYLSLFFICLSFFFVSLFVCLSVRLSLCLSVSLFIVCPSPAERTKKKTMMRAAALSPRPWISVGDVAMGSGPASERVEHLKLRPHGIPAY